MTGYNYFGYLFCFAIIYVDFAVANIHIHVRRWGMILLKKTKEKDK